MNNNKLIAITVLAMCTNWLLGCSDSSDPAPDTPSIKIGQFKDTNTSGLNYRSGSVSGITNSNGEFKYESGKQVTFYVGGVTLGTTSGKDVVTPVDMIPRGTAQSLAVNNVVRFLMMLDSDDNPDNGINISRTTRAIAKHWDPIDFYTNDIEEEMADIIATLEDMAMLPSPWTAENHISSTVSCVNSGAFSGSVEGDRPGRFMFITDRYSGIVYGYLFNDDDEVIRQIGVPYDEEEESDEEEEEEQARPEHIPVGMDQDREFISYLYAPEEDEDLYEGFDQTEFSGQFPTLETLEGEWNWQDNNIVREGSFEGQRIGGELEAKYRYSAFYSGASVGVMTFDIDESNVVSGYFSDIIQDTTIELSGSLSGTTLSASTTDGTDILASVDLLLETIGGTWVRNDDEGGSLIGAGCLLN